MRRHHGLRAGPRHHLEAKVRQAFAEEALGRAHKEDGLLQLPAPADQADLLPGVLSVVPRVGLVGHQMAKGQGKHRKVDVYDHPAAQVAEVVVET